MLRFRARFKAVFPLRCQKDTPENHFYTQELRMIEVPVVECESSSRVTSPSQP